MGGKFEIFSLLRDSFPVGTGSVRTRVERFLDFSVISVRYKISSLSSHRPEN